MITIDNSASFNVLAKEKLLLNRDIYAPLEIIEISNFPNYQIRLSYLNKSFTFKVFIKSRNSPSLIKPLLYKIKEEPQNPEMIPAVLVTYLNKDVTELLNQFGISGFDLNGNYLIISERLTAIRLDRKNEYSESSTIKNIYAGNSSILSRYLLATSKTFTGLNELYGELILAGGSLALSTVSKITGKLEDDLIISKKAGITLLQPAKLLFNLKENYSRPKPDLTYKLKLPADILQARTILTDIFGTGWMLSGESAAGFFTTTTPPILSKVYTNSFPKKSILNKYAENRFYNYSVEFLNERYNYIFFDSSNNIPSKIQTYLDLITGDKRSIEIAMDIEKEILDELKQ